MLPAGKVEEMHTLQRALKEANALIQEKQRIHAQLDKQREELKKVSAETMHNNILTKLML